MHRLHARTLARPHFRFAGLRLSWRCLFAPSVSPAATNSRRAISLTKALVLSKTANTMPRSRTSSKPRISIPRASQYIPGAPSEQNKNIGKQAIAEFKEILQTNADNLSAIDGIGSILFQMAGTPYDPKLFEESKTYHQKHIQLKPEDPEPYYWIGVIDWTLAFRANGEMRKDYNEKNIRKQVKDTDPLPAAIRGDYLSKYGSLIDEGITDLQKAISLRPDYDDAMAYLNLLYRRKADTVESADERASLQKQADDLVDKVKEVKQRRASQPAPTT